MKQQLEEIHGAALRALAAAHDEAAVDQVRVAFLGRKGRLTDVVRQLRDVPQADRPALGAYLNEIKDDVDRRVQESLATLRAAARARAIAAQRVDVTLPGTRPARGRLHPVTQTLEHLIDVFVSLGFDVADGPDVEDDYHNFTALNFPPDHPARDMQDTFFVADGHVLRTHTSPVQVRVMERHKPPLRVIAPGATYRHGDSDVTHSPMFHQIEGFMVDRRITFGDLKGVLTLVVQRIFDPSARLRFRASFFPFTEPSAEVDVNCQICNGADATCRVCKGTGWLEILGAGMIDPNVFAAVGYDAEQVSGFAFGMGVERIAMLKYQIGDIRLFFGNDLRFLRQF